MLHSLKYFSSCKIQKKSTKGFRSCYGIKGGAKLISEDAIKILKDQLIKSDLITPNIPEEVLTKIKIKNTKDMIDAGKPFRFKKCSKGHIDQND